MTDDRYSWQGLWPKDDGHAALCPSYEYCGTCSWMSPICLYSRDNKSVTENTEAPFFVNTDHGSYGTLLRGTVTTPPTPCPL